MSVHTPKYRYHKGSGQALVEIDGRRIYLGKFDTEESKEKYRRIVAEWLQQGHQIAAPQSIENRENDLTIVELILAFIKYAETYYVKNGKQTDELNGLKAAFRPLKELYGHDFTHSFGPKQLKTVRL